MLEKEFVVYPEAFELKQLGFDEPCLGYYVDNKFEFFADVKSGNTNSEFRFYPTTPTYSQAFRWFRDKGYEAFPKKTENNEYYYTIEYGHWTFIMDDRYNSYEEAELACLKQLIEMLKLNNDTRRNNRIQ